MALRAGFRLRVTESTTTVPGSTSLSLQRHRPARFLHGLTTQKWLLCPFRCNSRPRTCRPSHRHQGLVGRWWVELVQSTSVLAFHHQTYLSDASLRPVKSVILTGLGHITLLGFCNLDSSRKRTSKLWCARLDFNRSMHTPPPDLDPDHHDDQGRPALDTAPSCLKDPRSVRNTDTSPSHPLLLKIKVGHMYRRTRTSLRSSCNGFKLCRYKRDSHI